MRKTAFISVTHKDGIVDFAKGLVSLGWDIISTGGTAKCLEEDGVPVRKVEHLLNTSLATQAIDALEDLFTTEIKAEPILDAVRASELDLKEEIKKRLSSGDKFGGLVKSLSREVAAGLLYPNTPEALKELERNGMVYISLVCCDFYELKKAIEAPDATFESVIKATDIGGPTMVRECFKGGKDGRIVICDPADRQMVLDYLRDQGEIPPEVIRNLMAKAEFTVAKYCLESARYHSDGDYDGIPVRQQMRLYKAENGDQNPADLMVIDDDNPFGWAKFKHISGDPGFVNVADADKAIKILCLMVSAFRQDFARVPYIVIACKHGNPCGAAMDWEDPHKAIVKAMMGNLTAVMGAEVITNFRITEKIAKTLKVVHPRWEFEDTILKDRVGRKRWGQDFILAPGFDEDVIEYLSKRSQKDRVLMSNPALSEATLPPYEWVFTPIESGVLRQKAPRYIFDPTDVEELIGDEVDANGLVDMIIAFACAWRGTSNTITLARDGMLIGPGFGQNDRRTACWLAYNIARFSGHKTEGCACASDAFFFKAEGENPESELLEGPEMMSRIGCRSVLVPADGKYLSSVKDYFREKTEISTYFLHSNHRGFCRH